MLWTRHLSGNFLVFVCAGILHGHRGALLSCDMGLDGLLRVCLEIKSVRSIGANKKQCHKQTLVAAHAQYINDLEMTMNVEEVLTRGEALYRRCANDDTLPGMA